MLPFGLVTFLDPWFLVGLALLPALWWLLKVTPPAPRKVRFPALRLLLGLRPGEETPARTPLWLALLRLALAALVVLALAHPVARPGAWFAEAGPVWLVVDDGWAAARDWAARRAAMAEIVDQAEREGRPVRVLTTAPPASGEPLEAPGPMAAADARRAVQALTPKPWPADREAALAAAGAARAAAEGSAVGPGASGPVVWISDGVDDGAGFRFAEGLQRLGGLKVLADLGRGPHLLLPPVAEGGRLLVRAVRPGPGDGAAPGETVWVRALDGEGRVLAREELAFAAGEARAEAALALPVELANRIARLDLEGEATAGAVVLLDERWRRRLVGIATAGAAETERPLLGETYYVDRALAPFNEVRRGELAELLRQRLSVLVLGDTAAVPAADREALQAWVAAGGVLLRFAGPRLAQGGAEGGAEADGEEVPVRLRHGGRTLGGLMSWTEPMALAPFEPDSPFARLAVPDDVRIAHQVLAQPALDLAEKTWAQLADGTPLVTAERRGEGWLVLFHVTADPRWSDLPLSGLFVEMLQRVVALSRGVAGALGRTPLEPLRSLDGFGQLAPPPPAALAVPADRLAETPLGPEHPPGLYGVGQARVAVNLSAGVGEVAALGSLPEGAERVPLAGARERDLKPWLLTAAFVLALIDLAASLALRGLLRWRPLRRAAQAALLAPVLAAAAAAPAAAQDLERLVGDDFAIAATRETRLAYVRTDVAEVDELSRAGLSGLSRVVSRRTSVELAEPLGVDIESDTLLFFPLLYWPVTAEQPCPSDEAVANLNRFLRTGGTLLLDTRDQQFRAPADADGGFAWGTPAAAHLRRLLRDVEVPPLVPAPPDHVLTKSYYLMQEFPGRWSGGTLWVEAEESRLNDGVSPVIIGSNDWPAAWAMDRAGRSLYPAVPGGSVQREMAFRFGINLVMYALTGNYKSDQVHVPAILERLGQ